MAPRFPKVVALHELQLLAGSPDGNLHHGHWHDHDHHRRRDGLSMTPILLRACARCGGALIPDEDGDYICLLCGRPRLAPESLPLVTGHGELGHHSKYQRKARTPGSRVTEGHINRRVR